MRKIHSRFQFSAVSLCSGIAGLLAVTYIGLIAVVMTYGALTIEFTQSVKSDEATVATLESKYLTELAYIQSLDYRTIGYAVPSQKLFVPAASVTALR